jgi:hypothetical protein
MDVERLYNLLAELIDQIQEIDCGLPNGWRKNMYDELEVALGVYDDSRKFNE